MMITHNLGYPRIGNNREIKKAIEGYWSEKISYNQLIQTSAEIKQKNWLLQKDLGIDLIPSNDFSFYDHVLDMAFTIDAIPERYSDLPRNSEKSKLDLYFAMARGFQNGGVDIIAMEMTKWFDTNYHYIVPEFYKNQKFSLSNLKFINEFLEAKKLSIITKPVLLGPVSFLLLGKEKESDFDRIDLLENLLTTYLDMLKMLISNGAKWIQFDEPFLALDLTQKQKKAFKMAYLRIRENFPEIHILVATYFEGLHDNSELAMSLPVDAIHLDLVKAPEQLENILNIISEDKILSLGIVDGRNIWKNNFENSLKLINNAIAKIGEERVMIAPSCSLLHVPCDLNLETNEKVLPPEIKQWLAFAKQKIEEVVLLKHLSASKVNESTELLYKDHQKAFKSRETSQLIHNNNVKERINLIEHYVGIRRKPFPLRKKKQQKYLGLPLFPTTTIGSFPQTSEVRSWRAKLKKKELSLKEYNRLIQTEIERIIRWQENVGLDVLVHGEFERNDMVEYFGEMLDGFTFTRSGWVQSYGTRYVKPPIIFGDVLRPIAMTVDWIKYAQSLTSKPVKGMLTGPVTILEWSFVRDDQPRSETCYQIALAIRDEVLDLERAKIKIIQLDEPALREGLPLRKKDWKLYLDWSVKAFRLSYAGVKDETQIHTHMCYSEFNDIIQSITALDADVITIECSRSQMELLDAFNVFEYPNDIGPGVYDIHSPRVPSINEMVDLLKKAAVVIPKENIWVNPDCGLKTRGWEETNKAIIEMVNAARLVREKI
jgi:5-methyltetrahydropteroyltriglutamate--homocysteine methyltransferase